MSTTYYSSARREILAFLPPSCQLLLDVGCSEGGFGAAVLAAGRSAEVWGIEPHAPAASVAGTRLTRVFTTLFGESLDVPDGHFDVVTFNDTLEHMVDEYAALRLAHRKLKAGGTLVCSVPNVRYIENLKSLLMDADWQYADSGILDRTHLRFFTKKSIRRTVEACGFVVQHVEGINSHWWSGWKIGLLRLLFRKAVEDARWLQFVLVARKP